MQLPIMGSPEEALEFVKYLSTKVNGSTLEDAKAAVDKKLVDPRKITAYVSWGFITKDAERMKLTALGRKLVKANSQEEKNVVYRKVIESIDAYQGMIENLYYNKERLVITNIEAATYWLETKKFDMGNDNENTLKDRAVCFFKVCEAAGLGKFCLGRRGQYTRLELSRDAINDFVEKTQEESNIDDIEITQNEEEIALNIPTINVTKGVKEENGDVVPLVISFVDGRKAVLNMPKNADKEDAQYVYDILRLMLTRQYKLKETNDV